MTGIPWATYSNYSHPDVTGVTEAICVAPVTPPSYRQRSWTGDKYEGGFGVTDLLDTDYQTLRDRSEQIFKTNMYARGLINRLITNEINTGLSLESTPLESVLGYARGELNDWSENVETLFQIYSNNPKICDWSSRRTYGELQKQARLESLICGDVLIVIHMSKSTGLPQIELISGNMVETPFDVKITNEIRHGVELNSRGEQVAYWVRTDDFKSRRIPAVGPKSGRRIAWLSYGLGGRVGDVRGEPILSIMLQSLQDVDKYRDSALRKALVNSIVAMFIKKDQDRIGTMPMAGAAVRRDTISCDTGAGEMRSFNAAQYIPGVVIEELQYGETPVPYPHDGTDIRFTDFERAIINGIAWASEVPPEILTLMFSSNYSASQAAVNEFKLYLNKARDHAANNFDKIFYREWFLSSVIKGDIAAPGFLDAARDLRKYVICDAWTSSEWCGAIKPSVDPVKQVRAYREMIAEGFITYDRATREMTGTKFTRNIERLFSERKLLAELNSVEIDNDSDSDTDADVGKSSV